MHEWLTRLDHHFPVRYAAWATSAVLCLLFTFCWVAFGFGGFWALLFLFLVGLGVRDIRCFGDDLLILAGPTMDLDGHVLLYRWRGGARVEGETVVERQDLEVVLDFPHGSQVPDHDHPEGVALFEAHGRERTPGLLIVYDAPAPDRCVDGRTVLADLFAPSVEL